MDNIAGEIIPIIAISGGVLVAIVAIVCGTILSMYKYSRQSNLKQMMMEAGLSPQDIERVINSGSEQSKNAMVNGGGKSGPY